MNWSFNIRGGTACLLAASLALTLSGCGHKQAAPSPGNDPRVHVQSTTPGVDGRQPIKNPKAVAAHLEQLARGVKGVRGANCVVFGKYAIVGIDVEPTMERARVGTVKYAVAEAFRKDPYGINALVTADVDLAQRVREIRADTKRGRPIAGFTEELADIVGRLVPQIPRNIVPPASPDNVGGGMGAKQLHRNPHNAQKAQ
ncbi:YhcN/YlaJ family sporulation lipoprotein [Cohnella nanjingensis]|uniref:YhcN/YlaJ family sporulation lipoprotein n=1 Tax=Cohnella nanjingensis TaxID=1387779 RepID=A0A7X0RXP4_9BACL|nr:YhcN/YlaJ family sporulation lipoprotein [Cohnella nanjingensis]MBB6675582.1 YhcN/YlaJ family sporulation lipoprotein [Cohnella nanjingensis]